MDDDPMMRRDVRRPRAQAALLLGAAIAMTTSACAEAMAPAAPPGQPSAVMTDDAPAREEAGAATSFKDADGRLAQNRPAPKPVAPGAPPPPPEPSSGKRDAGGEVAQMRAPMLIYTARITMAVFEVNASLTRIEGIGRELGGFLAKRDDRSVTIRVPAQRFDEAVKRIEDVGDMLHRNVSAEDVTEEFRDLEVRLSSARAVQKRLAELLQKAVKVEESIAIERELDRVTGEIERFEGRMKFLRDRAAFSTITVTFEPKPKEQVGAGPKLPVSWLYDLGLRRLLSL